MSKKQRHSIRRRKKKFHKLPEALPAICETLATINVLLEILARVKG